MKRFASERVAGLMERLGLDDDVAIESRLVSRTIESAQTRVEGYNFDIRKRVVEFDDVINKQRETIYAERDKVLRNEDLTETVDAFLGEEMDALLATYCAAEIPDDWNMDGLAAALHAMGLEGPGTSEDELWEIGGRAALSGHLRDLADAKLEEKSAEVGAEDWQMIERLVLLRTIDSLWVEHLTELDDMRRGIGLRGYAQQDPLNEFKKEAFNLYDQLGELIRHQVATTIFRVSVVRQPAAPTPDEAQLAASLAAGAASIRATGAPAAGSAAGGGPQTAVATQPSVSGPAPASATFSGGGSSTTSARPSAPSPALAAAARNLPAAPVLRSMQERLGDQARTDAAKGANPAAAKLGRNDPCYCGSGLKFKKCHGR
jgi:preprotein translocase subunit SecA